MDGKSQGCRHHPFALQTTLARARGISRVGHEVFRLTIHTWNSTRPLESTRDDASSGGGSKNIVFPACLPSVRHDGEPDGLARSASRPNPDRLHRGRNQGYAPAPARVPFAATFARSLIPANRPHDDRSTRSGTSSRPQRTGSPGTTGTTPIVSTESISHETSAWQIAIDGAPSGAGGSPG